MTLPRTVADVLGRHVTFEIESIDRMYCNVYQPRLQYPRGAASFFHFHRGHTFASSALMAPMTKAFVAGIHDFVDRHGLDLVSFAKDQRKDDLTQSYLAAHDGSEGVLYVGRAQEKAALLRKWLRRLPHPFTRADYLAGYRYEISILQAEFSLTQMLDAPVTGRIFFEQVIRDNLDIGRPDHVGLVFARRIHNGRKQHTPGRFRTRIITSGVTPSPHVDYKHATIKQYHKEGRALRTETTINDPGDFNLRKGLTNLTALREVGFTANRRLLHVEHISHDPAAGAAAFTAVTAPATIDGQHGAALRFGDPRAQALLAVLLVFRLHPNGFTNADLRSHLTLLLGADPTTWPAGRATYDLRRLRLHGLIERIPNTHRYRVTDTGLHHAMFLTRVHDRLIRTGTAHHADPDPPPPSPLRAATRAYDTALNHLTQHAGLAA